MASLLFFFAAFGLTAINLVGCLAVDGVLPIAPRVKLLNFPFRGRLACNGLTITFSVLATAAFVDWLVSGIGMVK